MENVMPELDFHLLKCSFEGPEYACGDLGFIRKDKDQCFIGLIDVLGHGEKAHQISLLAKKFLENNYQQDLISLMKGLHETLKGTRGAVGALCRLDLKTSQLNYVGVGNINVKIYGNKVHKFTPKDGIIGYMISSFDEQIIKLYQKDILVLTSDGIKEHFCLEDYPGLLSGSASKICSNFINELDKGNDDASCLVLRYLT